LIVPKTKVGCIAYWYSQGYWMVITGSLFEVLVAIGSLISTSSLDSLSLMWLQGCTKNQMDADAWIHIWFFHFIPLALMSIFGKVSWIFLRELLLMGLFSWFLFWKFIFGVYKSYWYLYVDFEYCYISESFWWSLIFYALDHITCNTTICLPCFLIVLIFFLLFNHPC
jgi:hypothetical protein